MNAVVGAKKGSKKQRQPVISPDSAQSKTFIKVLYGLAEGEIEGLANGLQSIYLEETPLQNADGSLNFENVKVDFRNGTNDQEYIEGFPAVENETAIDVELKSETPWVRAFSNLDLDAVRLRLKWGPLRTQNATNGDVSGVTIEYAIDLQIDGGVWTEVLKTKISDKTSANYERAHRIDLPRADSGWLIRVRRLTPNSTSEYVSDKMYIAAVTEVIDAKLRYPNTALLGLQYDAETFGNVAKVAMDAKGRILKVPTNYNPVTRQYVGMWDGTFKEAYSNNPAWIYYDICTVDRYALGDRLTPLMVDKWSLYRLAQYCDQMVPDGLGGQEPRFTCNVYLQSAEGAFEILTKLAGVFRAITFWDGNSIICDADIPQDTYFTYTRANVIDGNFEYAGTRARDRHNVVKVAWDNPANHYKTEYEFVRDEKAIAEAGQVRILELDAWGCTSRGQAQRAGHWALKSEQLETRTVSFKVGLDGYIPLPGKVIEVADPLFAGRANGGRVSAISADRKSITLDRDDVVAVAGDRLIINGEDGKAQTRIVQSISGRVVTVTHEFDAIATQNVWVIDAQDLATMKFRVISITQDESHQFSVTALQYNPAKFDAIDKGAYFDEVPISIVNPTIQDPVTNVVVTSESRVDQGINVATMIVSWTQAKGAVKYQVEWRKDDGSWIKLPVTGNNSVEVPGIYAGQYQARVTAISAFEIASLPVYSTLTELSGKQGLPPKPAFIQATGILFGIKLNWGFPSTGALDTAYTEIEVSPDGTSNIAQLGLFAYPTTTHAIQGLQSNLTQFYRGRLIDRIGNIGPWSDWTHATTSADATDVLELLNDQISESQLNQDLKTKIDHIETIDAEIGPIKQDIQNTKDRIAQEVIDRQNAIQQAKDGLSQQIIDGDEGVLKVVNTVKQSSDDGLAAAQESIRVVANDLSLVAEKTDGVYAQLNPPLIGSESDLIGNDQGFAGTWSVQSAMIEGDLALSKRIDTTAVELNNLQAYAQREVQARIEGDRVTVQKIDNYIASNDSALATVRQSAQVAVEQSSANAEAIDLINLELDDKASTGQLTQVKSDIKNVDDKVAAQTVRIDGVFAQLNPPLIGSESDLIGNEGGYAGVWSEQSARIEGDLAQSKRTDQVSAQMNESNALFQQQINANASAISSTIKVTETLQTKVGKNSSSIQNVSESVDGIYAQQFIKFDVNGHVSGHGSMNDGTTSTFIFNYDRIQFGTPVGIDGIEPKPLMTLQNKPVTLPNGTVIPRGLYVDNGSFGYINANRIWAENLSVISADLGTIKVKTANIEDGAIDTLKIKDEAVTVPIGVKAIDIKTINTFSGGSTGGLPNNDFSNHLSAWEEHIGTLLQVTLNRSGGKVRLDASVNICTPSFGAFSVGDGRGKPIAANDRAMASFYISIYRNGSLIGRGSLGANIETGNINVNFNGTAVIVSAIDDISTVGNVTYTLKAGFARQEGVNIPLNVSSNNTFMITSRTLSVIEMKK
ncbi:phage-related protein, tail component [Acinetobacter nosocomialis 28F]|uniref:Phage-related protein, tail component n=3 Tax=Acinetobacter calcoaceticus/baumannii complex TaxID=909768 RepID=A0AA36KC43_ACINO|nr:phage tail protein [Acinetobacter nosocomialis]CDG74757.1 phage-related protein, tail component [Acinetobacter nosocomialis 28F]